MASASLGPTGAVHPRQLPTAAADMFTGKMKGKLMNLVNRIPKNRGGLTKS